jgi:hypothetical protein
MSAWQLKTLTQLRHVSDPQLVHNKMNFTSSSIKSLTIPFNLSSLVRMGLTTTMTSMVPGGEKTKTAVERNQTNQTIASRGLWAATVRTYGYGSELQGSAKIKSIIHGTSFM